MAGVVFKEFNKSFPYSYRDQSDQDDLRKNWWPVAYVSEIQDDMPHPITLFGEPLVLFRNGDDEIECLQDVCPHKSVPLSLGHVEEGKLVCRYHGWAFGAKGRCVKPATLSERNRACVKSYRTFSDGLIIWVYPDESEPVKLINPVTTFSDRAQIEISHCTTKTFVFDHPWELWAASFVDGNHHEYAHANTFLPVQRGSLNFVFDPTVSPAAMVVYGKHDKWVGVLAYLLFCPTHENAHKQFLTLFPTSERLSPLLRYGAFRALRLPELLYSVVYEDYYIIEQQWRRIQQGASKWGIGGKYGAPVSEHFCNWHRQHENDAVWFKGFGGTQRKLDRCEPYSDLYRKSGNDCGKELAPFEWRSVFNKRNDKFPHTWRKLSPYQRLIKSTLTRFGRLLTAN